MPSLYGYAPVGALAEQPSLEQMLGQLMQPRAAQMSDTQVLDSMGITRDQLDRAYQNPNTILPMGGAAAAGLGGAISGLGDIIAKRPYQDRSAQSIQSAQNAYAQGQQRTQANEMGRLKANMAIGQQRTALQQAADTKRQNLFAAALNMYKIQNPKPPALAANMEYLGLDPKNPAHQDRYFKMTNQGKGTNVTVQNAQGKGLGKAFEALATPKAKELGEFDTAAANNEPIEILQQLELINGQIESSGFLGELKDTAQRFMETAGVPIKVTDETSWRDLYKSLSTKLALDALEAFKGTTTDFEFGKAESVNGSLSATQAGRALIIQSSIASHYAKQQFAEAYAKWGYNEMINGRIHMMVDFKKTDEYKALSENTIFVQNPKLMVEYRKNLDNETWDSLVDSRARQIESMVKRLYPDMNEDDRKAKAQGIIDMEMRGLNNG